MAIAAIVGSAALALAGLSLAGQVDGLDYVVKKADNGPGAQTSIIRDCPSGTHASGGGVLGKGAYDQQQINSIELYDGDDANDEQDDGWIVLMDNQAAEEVPVKVHVVCSSKEHTYAEGNSVAVSSGQTQTATLTCGDGHAIAGGMKAGGGIDQQNLVRSHPIDSGDLDSEPDDGWQVTSHNVSVGQRSFRVQIVCAKGDYEYVSKAKGIDADQRGTVQARCPGGSHVVGGGANATGTLSGLHLQSTYPRDLGDKGKVPDDAWQVRADDLDIGGRTVTAHAICKS